ncbi:Rhodanese domain protein [Legionella gratiana]|uniref:Rhodanese domain protein n=1 Tax=Legionella gratiana TaxID=45066 RepID=A0A378J7A8_9GAMM|nr:rhodanese-like domain-containing protein [Legionella gratiana]KTD10683.1 Rhodanese domain protein [Legionella gratiana]STX43694.1 Rhodanese domain protein [Legionella gratiana]
MINPNIKTINVHELKNKMKNYPDLCLIDVRELNEWEEFHIPGAIHIPKDSIISSIESKIPNKNQAIYLHCKAGVRSLYAAQSLITLGYQEVYSVNGGILEWASSGYPIEKIHNF